LRPDQVLNCKIRLDRDPKTGSCSTPVRCQEKFLTSPNVRVHRVMSIERNPFSAQNRTLRSYRVYISPTK